MSPVTKTIAAAAGCAALAGGALALSATAASAYVACNAYGECWHVHDRLDYPPAARVVIHEDGWVFDQPHHYRWVRDRDDRGYWQHNHWRRF